MQTIGQYFKHERLAKSLTLEDLESSTRIKKDFLKKIESDEWKTLPAYPVVLGFIKSIAHSMDLDEAKAVALLRRDYPPQSLSINPKPDLAKEFHLGPRFAFLVGVLAVILIIGGYLIFQYNRFINPPHLEVFEPTQGQIVNKKSLKIIGKTDTNVTIEVNNQPVIIKDDGTFETNLEIFEGTKEIKIVATSRSGKSSTIIRQIEPNLN